MSSAANTSAIVPDVRPRSLASAAAARVFSAPQDASRRLPAKHHGLSSTLKPNCIPGSAMAVGRESSSVNLGNCQEGFFHSLLGRDKLHPLSDEIERLSVDVGRATLAVTVSSAVELDKEQMEGIARKMRRLTGFRNLRLLNVVDPSLIAGFVICYDRDGSHAIDLSVKGQLAELAERIETTEKRRAELEKGWTFSL